MNDNSENTIDFSFKPVTSASGNITEAAYPPESGTMAVRFSGGATYRYENVPREKWDEFEATFADPEKSTGGFFHRHFRNKEEFPCQKI